MAALSTTFPVLKHSLSRAAVLNKDATSFDLSRVVILGKHFPNTAVQIYEDNGPASLATCVSKTSSGQVEHKYAGPKFKIAWSGVLMSSMT